MVQDYDLRGGACLTIKSPFSRKGLLSYSSRPFSRILFLSVKPLPIITIRIAMAIATPAALFWAIATPIIIMLMTAASANNKKIHLICFTVFPSP